MTAFVNNVTYNFEKDVELEEESDFLYIFHLFFQNLAYPLVNCNLETSQRRLLSLFRPHLKPPLFKRESDKGRKET